MLSPVVMLTLHCVNYTEIADPARLKVSLNRPKGKGI